MSRYAEPASALSASVPVVAGDRQRRLRRFEPADYPGDAGAVPPPAAWRGDPALEPMREKLLGLVHAQAHGFFQPAPGAPEGAADRVAKAAKTMNSLAFDTLVAWLEDSDKLSDERRFIWYGRIIREWRRATREAYELDAPEAAEKSDKTDRKA